MSAGPPGGAAGRGRREARARLRAEGRSGARRRRARPRAGPSSATARRRTSANRSSACRLRYPSPTSPAKQHRLHDQRAAVSRRPHLAHGADLPQSARPAPVTAMTATRAQRERREAAEHLAPRPIARCVGEAARGVRDDQDELREPADPDRRGGDVERVDRDGQRPTAGVAGVTREARHDDRPHAQHDRRDGERCGSQPAPPHDRERARGADAEDRRAGRSRARTRARSAWPGWRTPTGPRWSNASQNETPATSAP